MDQPIALTDRMLASLNATRPWVMLLAIVGFVFIALMVLMSLAMITGMFSNVLTPGLKQPPKFFYTAIGIFNIVMALVYVMPPLYLYRYAKAIAAIRGDSAMGSFENALKLQKSFWKFVGILIIVFLVLEVLLMIGMIFAEVYLAAHLH